MRFQNRFQQFMNHWAQPKAATSQQVTNMFLIVTHMHSSLLWALWAVSSFTSYLMTAGKDNSLGLQNGPLRLLHLFHRYHIKPWKKSNLRTVEYCFHMCDRIVIYFFIAS